MLTSSALLTDRYELTMLQAALHAGTANRRCVFEVFTRELAAGRRYGVLAGTGRVLESIADFRFGDEELGWLAQNNVVDNKTIDWLSRYRFAGDIDAYLEGEIYFPYSPVLSVEASFAEAVLLETVILSILNFDSAVASAAARMVSAADGRTLAEMGGRRTNEISAVAAARASYIAGFDATSNLEAGRSWGIPTMGTAAHAFTLLHATELDAFQAQIATYGPNTTLLVDTYNIEDGVRNAIAAAGPKLTAVRIDSGDLRVEAKRVRHLLDELGATETKITVTNSLDEYSIAALSASPVDSFGVGTSVVTGSGHPAAGFVYKLVSHQDDDGDWVSVAKASAKKSNRGGRKSAYRSHHNGIATAENIVVEDVFQAGAEDRNLLVPLVIEGETQAHHA
ncbi:MAG: nicotinate phosphoribosyltransferase, partial [Actinomycetes bacterium]